MGFDSFFSNLKANNAFRRWRSVVRGHSVGGKVGWDRDNTLLQSLIDATESVQDAFLGQTRPKGGPYLFNGGFSLFQR